MSATIATELERACPECADGKIVYNEGAYPVCKSCGLCLDEPVFDLGREWRGFDRETRDRAGPGHQSWDNRVDGTLIGNNLRSFRPETRLSMARMRRQQSEAAYGKQGTAKRNHLNGVGFIKSLKSRLSLPDRVSDNAIRLYRKAFKRGMTRSRNTKQFAGACLLVSINSDPATVRFRKDILVGIPYHTRKAFRNMEREIEGIVAEEMDSFGDKENMGVRPPGFTPPEMYIPQVCSCLLDHYVGNDDVSKRRLAPVLKENISFIEALARKIAKEAYKLNLTSGYLPNGVAGAVVKLACDEYGIKITQKSAAEAANCSEVTIRFRVKEMKHIVKECRSDDLHKVERANTRKFHRSRSKEDARIKGMEEVRRTYFRLRR